MGTRLILGALFTSIGFITLAVCYLGSRNPRQPYWTNDLIMGSIIIPICIGAITIGPMLIFERLFFHLSSLSFNAMAISAGILLAGVVIIVMMRISKRVAAYEVMAGAAAPAEMPAIPGILPIQHGQTPVKQAI